MARRTSGVGPGQGRRAREQAAGQAQVGVAAEGPDAALAAHDGQHVYIATDDGRLIILKSDGKVDKVLDLAREVQESLFPAQIPALPGISVAALNQPARVVSGDFYDIIGVPDDRMVAVCADVSGKGFAAALLAAATANVFRVTAS